MRSRWKRWPRWWAWRNERSAGCASVQTQPGSFDDFRPARHFALQVRRELTRRVSTRRLRAAIRRLHLFHVRHLEDFRDFLMEPRDDLAGCSRRREKTVPAVYFVARESQL